MITPRRVVFEGQKDPLILTANTDRILPFMLYRWFRSDERRWRIRTITEPDSDQRFADRLSVLPRSVTLVK